MARASLIAKILRHIARFRTGAPFNGEKNIRTSSLVDENLGMTQLEG